MIWGETLFFVFNDQGDFEAALPTAWLADAEEVRATDESHALDVIGELFYENGTPLPGFAVNLRLPHGNSLPDGWSMRQVFPQMPKRVWA